MIALSEKISRMYESNVKYRNLWGYASLEKSADVVI